MLERIREVFSSEGWKALSEQLSNENLVALFTHPYGMAALGVLLLISVLCKWRFLFVGISGALLTSIVIRYTIAGQQDGPNKNVLLFAGGAVAVGAFVIYFLFIRDD